MVERWDRLGRSFPYLQDSRQRVAQAYGARSTPEVFVFDQSRSLRYHGAIDDSHADQSKVTRQYLGDALRALLDGSTPPLEEASAIGCSIKWRV
jgi:hypothetical protein